MTGLTVLPITWVSHPGASPPVPQQEHSIFARHGWARQRATQLPNSPPPPQGPTPKRALLAWGGRDGVARAEGSLKTEAYLRAAGVPTDVVDIVNDHHLHDLTREENISRLEADIASGAYGVVGFAPVCSSLSRLLHPKVRDDDHLWGLPPHALPKRVGGKTGREYLDYHNSLLRAFFRLLRAALHARRRYGTGVWVENPADARPRLLPGTDTPNRFYDRRAAHSASLFRFPEFREAVLGADGRVYTLIQCPLGSPFWKPTGIWATSGMDAIMRPLEDTPCTCPKGAHLPARGRDALGMSLSRLSQEYGAGLYRALAEGMLLELGLSHDSWMPGIYGAADGSDDDGEGSTLSDDSDLPTLLDDDEGSGADSEGDDDPPPAAAAGQPTATPTPEIAYGPRLPPLVREAYERARVGTPPWASHRRLRAADPTDSAAAPYSEVHSEAATEMYPSRQAGQPSLHDDFPPLSLAGAPKGPIQIASLFMTGQYERVLAWIAEATAAFASMAKGTYRRVPTLVLQQECLQPWARGVIWDCRDPARCVLCQPTSADTPDGDIPGGHMMDRAAFRLMAERNGIADADIVATAGGGGIECRSAVGLEIVLAFHHAGLGANFEAGARVIDADVAAGFASQPQPHLPFVPTKLGPRNVVMQTRAKRLPDGGIEEYEKPRATFDLGYGGSRAPGFRAETPTWDDGVPPLAPSGVNDGVASDLKSVEMPSAIGFAQCAGVATVPADRARVPLGLASVDESNAYTHLLQQRLDWWLHSFFWRTGVSHSRRVVFGGAWGPNAFTRASAVPRAETRRRIQAFEAAQPPPDAVLAWSRERGLLQRAGLLPEGDDQLVAWGLRQFIDDANMWGLTDEVDVPTELKEMELDLSLTTSCGGTPFSTTCRLAVHVLFYIQVLHELDIEVSVEKTQGGDVVIALGLMTGAGSRRVTCPTLKRDALLHSVAELRAAVTSRAALQVCRVERFTGRAANLSQIYPAILLWIRAGYAVVYARRRDRSRLFRVRLSPGGRRELEFLALLDEVEASLLSNEGVPLICQSSGPHLGAPETLTVVTDASGGPSADDSRRLSAHDTHGTGGYAFHPAWPRHVFVVSEVWPARVATALRAAARPRLQQWRDTARADMLAVPAAELGTIWLVADAVCAHLGVQPRHIISIGDCRPAASALLAASSASPQMRSLVRRAYQLCPSWWPASVPREINTSADAFTHAGSSESLRATRAARDMGYEVIHVGVRDDDARWSAFTHASSLEMRSESDAFSVRHRDHPTEGATAVDVSRPSKLGNPFRVMRSGRLDEAWRDAVCDAFHWAHRLAMSGTDATSLEEIAALHELPPRSVAPVYAAMEWSTYAAGIRSETRSLAARATQGERLCLVCHCYPLRCHATSIAAWVRGQEGGQSEA